MSLTRRTPSAAAEPGGAARAAFAAAWARRPAGPLALAVSGGGDSVALMHLAAERGDRPAVVTVDHRLRPGSAGEAERVGRAAARLGLAHTVLRWDDDPAGNLQAAAREARYRLIADWAAGRGFAALVTGHTLDDQAETVVMRLARGSGIDGLAAMRERGEAAGLTLFRPLLGIRRETLRAYLAGIGADWDEDPSNEDRRFERVRAREALSALGLRPERLARTADHMARAAEALEHVLDGWAAAHVERPPTGEARVERAALSALPEEMRLRLLARLLGQVSGRPYRPRFDALEALAGRLGQGARLARTLHGCVLRASPGTVSVLREPAAVAPPVAMGPDGAVWDRRWRVRGRGPGGLTLGALGERGLALLGDAGPAWWRRAPRLARLTAPAIWSGEALLAAPLAQPEAGWLAETTTDPGSSATTPPFNWRAVGPI